MNTPRLKRSGILQNDGMNAGRLIADMAVSKLSLYR
jgi:hypothetical protein